MNKININLSVKNEYIFPLRRVEDDYVPTGLTINQRSYIEISQYCRMYNVSDSTVRRRLKKVEHNRCNEFFIRMLNKIYTHWAHLVISTLLPLLAEVPEGMFGHDLIHAQDLRCALDRKALWEDG